MGNLKLDYASKKGTKIDVYRMDITNLLRIASSSFQINYQVMKKIKKFF